MNNKNNSFNFSEDSELNEYFEINLKNIYDNFIDKFMNGNQLILNNINNKNDYPISPKKILSERIDLQKYGYNNNQNERDFCIWLINHGADEYPYLFEGTFRNNIILDWFSKNNRENIPRIIQAIWDSSYKLQRVKFLKKFKIFLRYFLIFKWDKFLINPNLSYESFFYNNLGIDNLRRFFNIFKFKKNYLNKIKVSLVGHVNYQCGIGQDVRQTYLALKLKGIKSEIIDFGLKKNNRETNRKLQFIKGDYKNYDQEILILCLNPDDCFNYFSSKRKSFFDRKYILLATFHGNLIFGQKY